MTEPRGLPDREHPGWAKLWAMVEPGEPHPVEESALGEYAALVVTEGPGPARRAFPSVAAHLDTGCAQCTQSLSEITEVLRAELGPSQPRAELFGIVDAMVQALAHSGSWADYERQFVAIAERVGAARGQVSRWVDQIRAAASLETGVLREELDRVRYELEALRAERTRYQRGSMMAERAAPMPAGPADMAPQPGGEQAEFEFSELPGVLLRLIRSEDVVLAHLRTPSRSDPRMWSNMSPMMMRTFGSQGLQGWEVSLDLGSPSAPVGTATTDDHGVATFVVPEHLRLSGIRAALTIRGDRYAGRLREQR